MNRFLAIFSMTAVAAFSTACSKIETRASASPAPIQNKVCEVRDWSASASAECQPGQKIVFLPNSWGNEQLPLLFAAVNCDMRYSVAMTNGGVVCIHTKLDADKVKEEAPAATKAK